MKVLHPKIQALRRLSLPFNKSVQPANTNRRMMVRADGKIVEDEKTGTGYLIVWGVKNSWGEIWIKGSCAKSIAERGPQSSTNRKIAFLWQHELEEPIGRFTKLEEDDYGLYAEWVYDDFEAVPRARQASSQVKSGTINQMSVGFEYVWDKIEYDQLQDAIIIKEGEIMEGSLVTLGANEETEARSIAADPDAYVNDLSEQTIEILRSLPMAKRIEIRALITRHISLSRSIATTQPVIETEDVKVVNKIDYKFLAEKL